MLNFFLIAAPSVIGGILIGVYAPATFDTWVKARMAQLAAAEKAAGGDLESLIKKLTAKKSTTPAPLPAPAPVPPSAQG